MSNNNLILTILSKEDYSTKHFMPIIQITEFIVKHIQTIMKLTKVSLESCRFSHGLTKTED